ncbi:hypothetical protein GCM10012275_34070 [Longimycelium tulufanense]|uniref:Formyl transferase N-terminal domain-containing protein n=1 Tax=Longimycelium tulufanense TaxID=907463 RepID=A0A8J3C9I4_9PSEU|nr:formyltransferase family protein [Longimycelium tulufanense]GGM60098.1 hypothetical protein GCM10012275_34070 [Longimycelium tulufanense]
MIFVGQGALLWRAVRFADSRGYPVDLVVSNDRQVERDGAGYSVAVTGNVNDAAGTMVDRSSDGLVWSINNPMIFRAPVLESGLRVYNVHNGPLPAYRGLPSIAMIFAILNGETGYGATLHEVDAGIDTGQVVATTTYPISSAATYYEVMSQGLRACQRLFEENLDAVATGTVAPRTLNQSTSGYYGMAQLGEMHRFVDHPNFARATELGFYGPYFPEVQSALADLHAPTTQS